MVLCGATILLALVGIAGVRQVLEPSRPDSPGQLAKRIEAAGLECGGVTAANATASTFVCGDDLDVRATYFHRRLTGVRYAGSYIPLKALRTERGLLSGDGFVVEGPYETVMRVQRELGGDLQRLSDAQ